MGWNGTYIDGIDVKTNSGATGSIQQAVQSSSVKQSEIFTTEAAKDDRWAKYRPVVSALDYSDNPIITINAYGNHGVGGGTIKAKGAGGSNIPGHIGNMVTFPRTISGTSRSFITFCGLDVPLIPPMTDPKDQVKAILDLTGTTNFNWSKTVAAQNNVASEDGRYKRAQDLNGYKPTADFPIEYRKNGEDIDYHADPLEVGVRYVPNKDPLRLFPGDLGQYFASFADKLVWGAAVSKKDPNGSTVYYHEGVLYKDANGNSHKMSVYDPSGSYEGWVGILITRAFYYGGTWDLNIAICGYIPPSSGTGLDGYAILLPSIAGGATTVNPIKWNIKQLVLNDPLQRLSFDVSAGLWGKAYNNPNTDGSMKAFPQGIPGYTLQTCQGLYSGSTFCFSLKFTNSTNSAVTLNYSNIVFDVTMYDSATFQPKHTERIAPTYYASHSGGSPTNSVGANSSLTVYVSLGNIWAGQTADTTSGYADMFGIQIKNTSYPNSVYPRPSAMFFAKKSDMTAWFFNCSWNSTANRMEIG